MPKMKTVYEVTAGCCYCSECMFVCPVNAITMDSRGAHINEGLCLGCGRCAANCASEAITAVTKNVD